MAFQLDIRDSRNVESMDIANQINAYNSISELIAIVPVTAEMIQRAGSERSAKFATLTANLNASGLSTDYAKCRLYAEWKSGYKEEHNAVYKNISELAENAGEKRQNFNLYAKVGSVFFSENSGSLKPWIEKRYSVSTLFELSVLPVNTLCMIDNILSTPDSDGKTHVIPSTFARRVKEVFNFFKKDADKFNSFALYKGKTEAITTLYSAEEFMERIHNYKLLLASSPSNEESTEESSEESTESKTDTSEKSGFSTYTFIREKCIPQSRIYSDGAESQILNYMSDNQYKIIATEHNNRGVIRTFIRHEENGASIRVVGVFPLKVSSIKIDVEEYNNKVRNEMEAKGAGEYFRPFTIPEYVDKVQVDTFADVMKIQEITEEETDENEI